MNARKGEIRLTSTSYVVLGMIDWLGPSTPYRLKRVLAESVQDFFPVPHTSFYAEPARLATAGYLDEHVEAGGRRRRTFALTDRCLLYTSPSPRDLSTSRMPSSA